MKKRQIQGLGAILVIGLACLFWFFALSQPQLVDGQDSPDGRYRVELYEVGSSFLVGPSSVQVTLKEGEQVIEKQEDQISNNGGNLTAANWQVSWQDKLVEVTLKGRQMSDKVFRFNLPQ